MLDSIFPPGTNSLTAQGRADCSSTTKDVSTGEDVEGASKSGSAPLMAKGLPQLSFC